MLTRIAPTRAVAYCSTTHSKRFGDQTPTRSPVRTPRATSAAGGEVDLVPQLAIGRAVALVADDERFAVAEALRRCGAGSRRSSRRGAEHSTHHARRRGRAWGSCIPPGERRDVSPT